jgi:hypothetical protein
MNFIIFYFIPGLAATCLQFYLNQEFILINNSTRHNQTYEERIGKAFDSLKVVYFANPGKYDVYYKNAMGAKQTSDKMCNYLQSCKNVIAQRSGGWLEETDSTSIHDDKNLEISTQVFLKEGHGKKLRDSLNWFVATMETYLGKGNEGAIRFNIDTDDPPKDKNGTQHTWEEYYWEGVPSIAAINELSKFQNDVRNAEMEVVEFTLKAAKR